MTPLLYVLHSGNLYGTERMALSTLQGLRRLCVPILLAPPGPVHAEAARLGLISHVFHRPWQLWRQMQPYFRTHPRLLVASTGVSQVLQATVLAKRYGNQLQQVHIVHGGTDENLSYGRKHWLEPLGVQLVAVSAFVQQRLLAHGCHAEQVRVIENFLSEWGQQRNPFTGPIRRVAVVSRLDAVKRIDVLLSALAMMPAERRPQVDIYGTGELSAALQAQAADLPQVQWHGFVPDIRQRLLQADLYLHTCPSEPFGLAVLEAMAAGVPVLVPDSGGAATLVQPGVSGFHYRANDVLSLAAQLIHLHHLPPAQINEVVSAARQSLQTRFNAEQRIADYARLLHLAGDAS